MLLTNIFNKNNTLRKNKLILTLFVIICLLAVTPTSAFAADEAQITAGNSGEVAPGEEFTVPVTLSNNPGFAGASLTINYDTGALELVAVDTASGIINDGAIVNLEGNIVGYLNVKGNNEENGVLFNLKFKVRENAPGGNFEVAIGLKDGTGENFVSYEAQVVPVSFTAGALSISGAPADGGNNGGNENNGTNTTPPDQTINIKDPNTVAPQPGTVGRPIFIEAEEGSLTWDTAMFDGVYDAAAGGYVLTPLQAGDSAITYTDPEGNEKSLDVVISEDEVATTASEDKEKKGNGVLVPIIIIIVIIIIAVVVYIMFRRNKHKSA